MSFRVRFVDPRKNYRMIKDEIDAVYFQVMENGDLINRHQLRHFEEHLAGFVGTKFAVGVNSGYDALHISLRAVGIGPGDEVIVPSHTFVASCSAIVNVGATPVLVDVKDDFNVDVGLIEQAITPRTRGIMPVHLNGCMADMPAIMALARAHGLKVVEDACQSLGAHTDGRKAGSWGQTGCWSFYPFKMLGGYGDGGAITTNDEDIARFAVNMRYNGEDRETGIYHGHGFTALLDNIQAAWLDVKLRHLPAWIGRRRAIAGMYREGFRNLPQLTLPHYEGKDHVYQNYVVMCEERDALVKHLRDGGIEVLVHWRIPYYRHEALGLRAEGFPVTERICSTVLSLPMNVEIDDDQVQEVIAAVHSFFRGNRR